MKILTNATLCGLFLGLPLQAALTLNYGNNVGGAVLLGDINGTPLTTGSKSDPGNGAIIQIGYYSMATTANPFAGDWVPLVGPGTSVEAANIGEILGDRYVRSGLFGGSATFGASHPDSVSYPSAFTPLSIRFYDGTSIDGSTHYNAVSMADWRWTSPTVGDSTVNLVIPGYIPGYGTEGLSWEGGDDSAYRTTIAIPEPSGSMLFLMAGSLFLARRKRSH